MTRLPGNDVSSYQGSIDWVKVSACGQRFAFIKATEGNEYQDKTFQKNWDGAKRVGLLRGAYHFFSCTVDPTAQADYFIDFVKSTNDHGELPPCLDFEPDAKTDGGKTNIELVPMVKIWLDRVESAFGRKPVIYSGFFNLKDYLSDSGKQAPAWAKDYPLWIAYYSNSYSDSMQPDLPPGWSNWTFWQYSKVGHVDGITENVVDMDVFNGSIDDLHKFAGATAAQKTYVVQINDTLNSIAAKNGTTAVAIATLNNVNKTDIVPGKVLKLP